MNLLESVYMGNTLQNWIIALSVLSGGFILLKIIQRLAIGRLGKLARQTNNEIDDLLVEVLKNTKFFILLVASAYLASSTIVLTPTIASRWEKFVILILILQGGFWLSAAISFILRKTIQKRSEEDSSTATTITFWDFWHGWFYGSLSFC